MAQKDVETLLEGTSGDALLRLAWAIMVVLQTEVNRLRARADLLLAEANRARQADGLAALTQAPLGTVTLQQFVDAVKGQL